MAVTTTARPHVRVTTALAVVLGLVAAALLVRAAFMLMDHPPDEYGQAMVSVWHCRPGHGAPTGGDMTDETRAAMERACQERVRPAWDRAVTLAQTGTGIGVLALGVAAVPLVPALRSRRRPGE